MQTYKISINQFAAFLNATPKGRKSIIKQQLKVNPILISWYRTARGAMKRYCKDISNQSPLDAAIELLKVKQTTTKQQLYDKQASILALQELKKITLPKLLKQVDFEIINPKAKSVDINNIEIIVAPDVIIRGKYKGESVVGAIKIHISKTKPFDHQQSNHVAGIMYRYLTKKVLADDEKILPELCFCLDIFSGRITTATIPTAKDNAALKQICEDLKTEFES